MKNVRGAWRRGAARAAACLLVTAVSVGALAGVAEAKGEYKSWMTKARPLTVYGYGSAGYAFGNWRVADTSNGTRSEFRDYQRINNADNHKVYVSEQTLTNAGYCYQPDYTNCTAVYYLYDSTSSAHTGASTWEWEYASTGVNSSASYARGAVSTRIDVPWRTDPGSGWLFTTGTSY